MISTSPMMKENVWLQKSKYDLAEKLYYEKLAKLVQSAQEKSSETAVSIKEKPVETAAPVIQELAKTAAPLKEPVESAVPVTQVPDALVEVAAIDVAAVADKIESIIKEPMIKVQESPKTMQKPKETNENKNQPEAKPTQEFPLKLQNGVNNNNNNNNNSNNKKSKAIVKKVQVIVKVEDPAPQENKRIASQCIMDRVFEEKEYTIKNETQKTKKKERRRNTKKGTTPQAVNSLAGEVAKAREHIKNSMSCIDKVTSMTTTLIGTGNVPKQQNQEQNYLEQKVNDMSEIIQKLERRVLQLEEMVNKSSISTASQHSPQPKVVNAPKPKPQEDDADDGVDLFDSDSEEDDGEAARIKEQRVAEYTAKKSKKPTLIAKSNIILDVKPWDDETDMQKMEEEVRKIETDGLLWGASKLVPLAYGIRKLQISCVVEDEKVSVDWLQETIQEREDFVQSVDIAAFNKI